MPPKRGKNAEPARPVRSSRRLQSLEPEVTSESSDTVNKPLPKKKKQGGAAVLSTDELIRVIKEMQLYSRPQSVIIYVNSLTEEQRQAVIVGLAKQNTDLEDRVGELEGEKESLEAELEGIRGKKLNQLRYHGTLDFVREKYGRKSQETQTEEKETPAPAAETAVAPPSPPEELAESATPVRRLAPPEVSAEQEPPATQTPSSFRRILTSLGGYIPAFRKRAAEDEPAAPPAEKRLRVSEPEIPELAMVVAPEPQAGNLKRAAEDDLSLQPAEKRSRLDESETPTPTKRTTPTTRPSARNPRVPTSLSTITEYTEPSELSVPDITPSKPSRLQSQSTPSVPDIYSPMPPSVPQSTPLQPYLMRRSAMVRAARKAEQAPPVTPYAWEKTAARPRPSEPNADVRQAKIQRMRQLQRELEELKQDADIKDMERQSVRSRKRVKIDHLASIPHNRPGDSSSTFRVPDIDSDDEMEVDASVEERSNIFEETETEKEAEKEVTTVEIEETPRAAAPVFNFPSVGSKPAEYSAPEEFKERAGTWFAEGFGKFLVNV